MENEVLVLVFDIAKLVGFIAVLGILAFVGGVGLNYLKLLIGEKKYNQIKEYAIETVRFLEQVGVTRGFSNADMKDYAVNTVLDAAEYLKLPMGIDGAERLVESMVQIVNSEQTKIIAEEIKTVVEE